MSTMFQSWEKNLHVFGYERLYEGWNNANKRERCMNLTIQWSDKYINRSTITRKKLMLLVGFLFTVKTFLMCLDMESICR